MGFELLVARLEPQINRLCGSKTSGVSAKLLRNRRRSTAPRNQTVKFAEDINAQKEYAYATP
jgi:hypothetical protein